MRRKLIFALLVLYGLLVLYATITLAAGGRVPDVIVPISTLTGDLGGPALAGFLALTPWVIMAWVSISKNSTGKAN